MIEFGVTGLEFHHMGVACRDLDREAAPYAQLGYGAEGDDFQDPIQGIRGRFLVGGGPRLELVAPLGSEAGVLAGVLAKGIKLYHLAYTCLDLDQALAQAALGRAKLVVSPVPAVAFGGRRIAFVMLPNMMLVEFIEQTKVGP
jgi:methylmalonyl-CoA/ethylmalonyl-CoA epimerase